MIKQKVVPFTEDWPDNSAAYVLVLRRRINSGDPVDVRLRVKISSSMGRSSFSSTAISFANCTANAASPSKLLLPVDVEYIQTNLLYTQTYVYLYIQPAHLPRDEASLSATPPGALALF